MNTLRRLGCVAAITEVTAAVVTMCFVLAVVTMFFAADALADPAFAAAKPAKVAGIKISSADDTSIGLSWAKARNAKKYEVAYRLSSSKSWKSKKTSSLKVTIGNLKTDKKYCFRVRGLNGSMKGKWSSMLAQKTYVRPEMIDNGTIFALERTAGQIRIKWRGVDDANGYKIRMWALNTWSFLDEQDSDYEEIAENKYAPITEYTSRVSLRPNTWYGFNVRAVNYKTGKFPALMSDWSRTFYACTTTGGRIITGREENSNGETIRVYDMNDIFVVGVDEHLIPNGVYEHTDYAGDDPVDTFYETDYMTVTGVSFPRDFKRLDDTNIEEDFAGKTYQIGDVLDGYQIQAITVSPGTSDQGVTGDFDVSFKLTDAYSVTLTW